VVRWRPGAGAGGLHDAGLDGGRTESGSEGRSGEVFGVGLPKIACDGYWLGKVWY
jgi:hypothetical protein